EDELRSASAAQPHLDEIRTLMRDKELLELELDFYRKAQNFPEAIEGNLSRPIDSESEVRARIANLDQKLSERIQMYEANFHPHWGELLWAGNDKSHFAVILERYACTYASKVSNLLQYSPVHYF